VSIHYADEKFYVALRCLTGAATQRQRLEDAYVYNLIHVKPEDLPETIRYKFRDFCEDITRVDGEAGEGAVNATIAGMTDEQVSDMVGRFLHIYDELMNFIRPYPPNRQG
jgi:hypothetical protein